LVTSKMKRIISISVLLFPLVISAQFYNKVDFDSENFPDELNNITEWLSPHINELFYKGTIGNNNFDGYFSIISGPEKPKIDISTIGLLFVLQIESFRNFWRSPEMKMRYSLKADRISRYRKNFDIRKMSLPKYYFEYALDYRPFGNRYIDDWRIIGHISEVFDIESTEDFIGRINRFYDKRFTLESLEKYKYTETIEQYQEREKRENNSYSDVIVPRGQRSEIEQLVKLIENELYNQSFEDVIFDVFIVKKNKDKTFKALYQFLDNLYLHQDYKFEINQSLIQEFDFDEFPVKIYLNEYSAKLINKAYSQGHVVSKDYIFNVKNASFFIYPNDGNYSFDMVFNGNFIDCNSSILCDMLKLYISINEKIISFNIYNSKNKKYEIISKKHKL